MRQLSPVFALALVSFSALHLGACGESPRRGAMASTGQQPNDVAVENPNAAAAADTNLIIPPSNYLVHAVRQAQLDAEEQADLTELVTTGSDDERGTIAVTDGAAANPNLLFGNAGNGNLAGNVRVDVQLVGRRVPGATLDGNVTAWMSPRVLSPNTADANVLRVRLSYALTRTATTGEVVHVATEGNFVVTKVGQRTNGDVQRSIVGSTVRTGSSAADANGAFAYRITHAGTRVSDAYAAGALTTRTLNGAVTVTDVKLNFPAVASFTNVVRSTPATCLCPAAGEVSFIYPGADDGGVTVGSIFHGCGAVTLDSKAQGLSFAVHGESQWAGCGAP